MSLTFADLQAIRDIVETTVQEAIAPLENDIKEIYYTLAKHGITAD